MKKFLLIVSNFLFPPEHLCVDLQKAGIGIIRWPGETDQTGARFNGINWVEVAKAREAGSRTVQEKMDITVLSREAVKRGKENIKLAVVAVAANKGNKK
ncbi:MAG: hypothetical protein CEN90_52 [Parcubacteria group bacterium Licking1014_17]|nr:MAG: hypothetical protein CEN90_52 [Parcubacteria group bacterium Licking1014_17]